MKYSQIFLGLGSNIGNRNNFLFTAIAGLIKSPEINVRNISSTYETKPLYNFDQGDFLNLVVEIESDYEPYELLLYCRNIESKMGRRFNIPRNSPRNIDIDIIFFNDRMVSTEQLTIPHPRLYERQFVLEPLNEIAPDFICPKTKKSVSELIEGCQDSSNVYRIEEKVVTL